MQQTPKASQVTQFLTWHKSRPKQQIDLLGIKHGLLDDFPIYGWSSHWNALKCPFLRGFSTKHVWFPEGTSGGSKRALESPFTPARGVHCFWRVCAGKGWLEDVGRKSKGFWICVLKLVMRSLLLADKMWEESSRRKSENQWVDLWETLQNPRFFRIIFFFRMFSVCPLNHWKSSIFPCWCGSGGFHSYLQDKPVRNSSLAKLFPVRNFSRVLQRFRERNRRFLCVDWGA